MDRQSDPSEVGRELEGLSEVARQAGQTTAEGLARAALSVLGERISYDAAALLEVDEDDEDVVEVTAVGGSDAPPDAVGRRVRLADLPVAFESLQSAEPRSRADAAARDLLTHVLGSAAAELVSVLVVPVVSGSTRMGVFLFGTRSDDSYPRSVAALTQLYGRLVGLGLEVRRRLVEAQRYRERLREYARLLDDEVHDADGTSDSIERSRCPAMLEALRGARQVAASDAPVLLLGETGTGKEMLARAVHDWSPRADQPFVTVNCGALPGELVESELFGHTAGAFTGAGRRRLGRFATADGGTLFLDEIGEMPLEMQVKLLRVLQEGKVQPVGSDRELSVDVRIIAATHLELTDALASGRFRKDLYYRLAVFPLQLPPLRERLVDLPLLCGAILDRFASRTGRGPWVVSPRSMRLLEQHDWPGNVRELVNTLERARILQPEGGELEIELTAMQARLSGRQETLAVQERTDQLAPLDDVVRRHVERVLRHTGGRVYGDGGAAELLGLAPSTLQHRIRKLGIDLGAIRGGGRG